MKPTILVVDDERNIRRMFDMVLRSAGYEVTAVDSGEAALTWCEKAQADVVLLDIGLPGIDGLEVLQQLRQRDPEQIVIMISGHGTISTAVEATRQGACDFLEKPISKERMLVAVENALRLESLDRQCRELRAAMDNRHVMLGESQAMIRIRDEIARVAPTSARVLISGESGTGKELVARAIHNSSDQRDGPFIKVNCAAIPEELIESELFGAVKGSYTGATSSRDGKFLQADGGTLFLDEIGDMSLRAQAKVLRVLQEGEIEKVGGAETLTVDVRVLAATNKDLPAEVTAGEFREDLYFRLNVVPITTPPLRERREDIGLLAEHFLARYRLENNLPPRDFTPDAVALLEQLPWVGNVRELHNAVERLAIMSRQPRIGPHDLQQAGLLTEAGAGTASAAAPAAAAAGTTTDGAPTGNEAAEDIIAASAAAVLRAGGLVAARQQFEAACIREGLALAAGNVSQAARLLGIDRTNLHKKIQSYGLADKKSGPGQGGQS